MPRGLRRRGIAVVERKSAAGNLKPDAVAGGEDRGGRLQVEVPGVNRIGTVVREQMS